jgi:hypothetical protein
MRGLPATTHPFLAIVAHYVTNDGKLGAFFYLSECSSILISVPEELLIDFREMVGQHSGENMAEEVWSCIEMYGLEGRVNIETANDKLPELITV